MQVTWHGAGSATLQLAGGEMVIDPFFSPAGTYGKWFQPNTKAPAFDAYLALHRPDTVLITHGHGDHFDLETVRRLDAALAPLFVSTPQAVAVLTAELGIDPGRCRTLQPGEQLKLPSEWLLTAYRGDHWYVDEEGERSAAKLRPYYGAMPCGGPMLQVVIDSPEGRVYVSGDTRIGPIPRLAGVRLAIVNFGDWTPDPRTGEPVRCIVTHEDVAALLERLQPETLLPIHFDWPLSGDPEVYRRAALAADPHVRVLLPAVNTPTAVP